MTTTAASRTTAAATEPPRDLRGFWRTSLWRTSLAILLPLPLLGIGLTYLLFPGASRANFSDELAAVSDHPGRMELLGWLEVPFFLGMVRRAWPSPGCADGEHPCSRPSPPRSSGSRRRPGHPPPRAEVGIALFLLAGVMAGLAVLGAAVWRSRTAPVWAGLALIVAGPTHPFAPNLTLSGCGAHPRGGRLAGVSWGPIRSGRRQR